MNQKVDDLEPAFNTRFFLEYAVIRLFYMVLSLFSPEQCSAFGSKIAKKIGPLLGGMNTARSNLELVFPGKEPKEYKEILSSMWDNLGRIFAEYPNLEYLVSDIEIIGGEHIENAIHEYGQAILISGHIGNWELMAPTLLRFDIPVDLVYRAPNNFYIGKLLNKYRSLNGKLQLLPKSRVGTRKLVEAIQAGRSIGILIDQKYNEGVEVPFFGSPAMTSPAFVELSQRYKSPIIPFRVERIDQAVFRITFFPQIPVVDESGLNIPAADVIKSTHTLLESWILERPDQWLWTHRRWKGDKKKKSRRESKKASKKAREKIQVEE